MCILYQRCQIKIYTVLISVESLFLILILFKLITEETLSIVALQCDKHIIFLHNIIEREEERDTAEIFLKILKSLRKTTQCQETGKI